MSSKYFKIFFFCACIYTLSCNTAQEYQYENTAFNKDLLYPETHDLYFESITPSDSLKASKLAKEKQDSFFVATHLKEPVDDFTFLRIKNQSMHKISFSSWKDRLYLRISFLGGGGHGYGNPPLDEHLLKTGQSVTLRLRYPISDNYFYLNPNYTPIKVMPLLDTIKYQFNYENKSLNIRKSLWLHFVIQETDNKRHLKLVKYE